MDLVNKLIRNNKDQIFSMINKLNLDIGLVGGPLFGGILYYMGGYSLPFYFFGIITIYCIPFINKMNIIKNTNLLKKEEEEEEDKNGNEFFTYLYDRVIKYILI